MDNEKDIMMEDIFPSAEPRKKKVNNQDPVAGKERNDIIPLEGESFSARNSSHASSNGVIISNAPQEPQDFPTEKIAGIPVEFKTELDHLFQRFVIEIGNSVTDCNSIDTDVNILAKELEIIHTNIYKLMAKETEQAIIHKLIQILSKSLSTMMIIKGYTKNCKENQMRSQNNLDNFLSKHEKLIKE